MDDLRLRQYTNLVHPLLSIYVPFVFISVVVVGLIGEAFAVRGVQVFPPYFPLILLLAGAAETITGNLLHQERVTGVLPRLRELIVVIVLSFGLILLFFGDLTSGDISLARANIWFSLIFVMVQWLLSLRIHTRLRDRELFLSFFQGKEPRAFQETYSTHNHEGGKAFEGLRSVRKLVLSLAGMGFIALIAVTWGTGLEIHGLLALAVLLFFVSSFLVASVLERYMDMLRVLGTGHVVTPAQTRQKNATMILVFIVVALIALPLAGGEAWLPVRHLTGFWSWLTELLTFDRVVTPVEPPEIETTMPQDALPELTPLQGVLGTREEGALADIARYIGYALLGLLGVGLLAFLIMPVLRLRDADTNLREALGKAIVRLTAAIRAGWTSLMTALRRALAHGRRAGALITRVRDQARAAAEAREAAAQRRARVGKEERRIHGKVLKEFMKFARWARRHGVSFDPSIAPREFSEMVGAKVPEHRHDCIEIAEIFEEIVYSNHEIESRLQARYHEKVAALVKSRS